MTGNDLKAPSDITLGREGLWWLKRAQKGFVCAPIAPKICSSQDLPSHRPRSHTPPWFYSHVTVHTIHSEVWTQECKTQPLLKVPRLPAHRDCMCAHTYVHAYKHDLLLGLLATCSAGELLFVTNSKKGSCMEWGGIRQIAILLGGWFGTTLPPEKFATWRWGKRGEGFVHMEPKPALFSLVMQHQKLFPPNLVVHPISTSPPLFSLLLPFSIENKSG